MSVDREPVTLADRGGRRFLGVDGADGDRRPSGRQALSGATSPF
jgi:hypothetical protein